MSSNRFFIFFIFIITWACLIETTFGAAGYCYQCNSNNSGCQLNLDAVVMADYKVPCNGQCYVRIRDNVMYRGCSWEFGFMEPQMSLTPMFLQESTWVFCDTPLCNGNANMSG